MKLIGRYCTIKILNIPAYFGVHKVLNIENKSFTTALTKSPDTTTLLTNTIYKLLSTCNSIYSAQHSSILRKTRTYPTEIPFTVHTMKGSTYSEKCFIYWSVRENGFKMKINGPD